jgi:hypothetical protein
MRLVRPVRVVATLAALVAVALGMGTYAHADFTNIHILFGLLVALILLALGVMAIFTRGMRRIGALGIVYAVLMTIFGVTQQMILAGDAHWLVETTHLAVGFGAVAFIGAIGARFTRQKAGNSSSLSGSQATREAQPIG